jgi:hypothetical protein
MEEFKDFLRILLACAGVIACLMAYLKLIAFLESHNLGLLLRSRTLRQKAPKVEIQTIFHGNTKDEDQI